jgi:hypothetical protein
MPFQVNHVFLLLFLKAQLIKVKGHEEKIAVFRPLEKSAAVKGRDIALPQDQETMSGSHSIRKSGSNSTPHHRESRLASDDSRSRKAVEQKQAHIVAVPWKEISKHLQNKEGCLVVEGGQGAGKSHMLSKIRDYVSNATDACILSSKPASYEMQHPFSTWSGLFLSLLHQLVKHAPEQVSPTTPAGPGSLRYLKSDLSVLRDPGPASSLLADLRSKRPISLHEKKNSH